MPYSIELSKVPLGEYREVLRRQNLLPARRILLDEIDRNFSALSAQKIDTLAQLKQRLSSPQKLSALAEATGISQEYLVILKREMGSLEQKPIPIGSIPGIDPALLSALESGGVRTTKDCWERGAQPSDELFCLCDLVRINGVGAAAARAFYAAGFRSVRDVAEAEAGGMLARVTAANARGQYYQAKLGEKDMQFCIDAARLVVRYAG